MILVDVLPPRCLPPHLVLVMYAPLGEEGAREALRGCTGALLGAPELLARVEALAGRRLPSEGRLATPLALPSELLLVCAAGGALAFWRLLLR